MRSQIRYGLWVDGPSWSGEITGGAYRLRDLRDPGGHRGIRRRIVVDDGDGWREPTREEWCLIDLESWY